MSSLILRTSILLVMVVLLGNCPPPPPPVINEFIVVPTNQCATVPVAVRWAADANSGRLTIQPQAGPTPPNPLPGLSGGGFRFETATTDTTYTLNVERGGVTASQQRTVHIVPNPFVTTLELPYDCANHHWVLPGFSDREYSESISVRSFTNLGQQSLLLEFGAQITELPPGVPTPLLLPVRYPGSLWIAHLANGGGPICTGPGTTVETPEMTPPPVRIMVTSDCPTR